MKRKENLLLLLLAVVILGTIVYTANVLLFRGVLAWQLQQTPYLHMLGELLLLFLLLVLAGTLSPSRGIRITAVLFFMAIFLWAHQIFLPVTVSGLYAAWLWLCGRWLRRRIFSGNPAASFAYASQEKAVNREFFLGCLFTICSFCLMSAFGIGKTENLWIFLLVFTGLMACDLRFWKSQTAEIFRAQNFPHRNPPENQRQKFSQTLMAAALLTIFCIQAGRMNIAVDFDSLWYGARSPYILNNGGGIYENLGTIGVVYTYSKGLEVLTLPLSILPSYSFVTAFNLWLAAGVLIQSWQIGCVYLHKSSARTMLLFLASLPGIMNMAVTAKSDMATLYIQLLMFFELLCYLNGERQALGYALGAFFFSWTLKPTAMVFSTAVMGMSILFLLFTKKLSLPFSAAGKTAQGQLCRRTRKGCPEPPGSLAEALAAFILSLAALTGIWARTFLITGLPVTSVFSSVLTRLGFQMNYPFNAKTIPNNARTLQEWLSTMCSRLYGVLFNPQGKDMEHVIIAWGSLSTWFLLCLWLTWLFLDKRQRTKKERMLDHYFMTVFLPFAACCLISLIMLYQVDGNYFMLFYVLSALCLFRLTERLASRKAARSVRILAIPVILFSIIATTLTNWAWALGFTPIAWKHPGYYPHQEIQHQEMIASGNGQIWDILAQNPRNRLISMGDHPQSLVFPCNAQSYRDITKNAWGNPELAETPDNFAAFMDYAKTDYVYVQADYITQNSHEWNLLCELIRRGYLTPLCYEEGNMLAYVDTKEENREGTPPEIYQEHLEEFMEKYNAWTEEDRNKANHP